MTSFAKALPFFFLLVLFSSLQVEARQRLFFSKVTRSNGNEPEIPVTAAPTPSYSPLYEPPYAPAADAPTTTSSYSPVYGPTYAAAPELTVADAPAYSPAAPESPAADAPAYSPLSDVPTYAPESAAADAPTYSPLSDVPTYAPESAAADAPTYPPLYGPTYAPAPESPSADAPLYAPPADAPEEGALLVPAPAPFDSEPELGYGLFGSADQETPTSMDAENEGLYENTNLYEDNSKYATNYNTDRYTTNYINSRGEGYTNSYDARNGNNGDGFEQQGMSDTRSLENGSLYQDDDVQKENNDKFNNGFQSGRGSATNEAYFGNSNHEPNKFNSMEEYEKYQENL